MKKFMSLLVVFCMVLSMSVTAFASSNPTGVPVEGADVTVHGTAVSYKAWRVLDLTTSLKSHAAGNPAGCDGTNHVDDCYNYSYTVNSKYATVLRSVITEVDPSASLTSEDRSMVKYLSDLDETDDADKIREFANALFEAIRDASLEADKTATSIGEFGTIDQGYYLIAEDGDLAEGDTRSLVMLATDGQESVEVDAKEGSVSLEKKVMNDESADFETAAGNKDSDGWVDYADADMHDDKVWFKLEGTLPEDFDDEGMRATYGTYKYIFHDTLTGLDLDTGSIKVYVYENASAASGTLVDATNYTVSPVQAGKFSITFDDLFTKPADLKAGNVIVVFYQATLSESATVGDNGNKNAAYIEYSSDPYAEGPDGDTNKTPEDYAGVFTFKLSVDKVDDQGTALAGANFVLEVWDANESAWVEYTKADNDTANTQLTDTTFTFTGLDVGKYRIVETKVPQGYAEADPIYFEIVAEYEGDGTVSNPFKVKTLTVQTLAYDSGVAEDGTMTFGPDTEPKFTATASTGTIETDVENIPGTKLPSTGGNGTYLIYGVGAMLVIAGGLLIVSKKRKQEN